MTTSENKYTKKDLDGIMQAFNVYLQNPEDLNDNLKRALPDYAERNTDLFVETVERASADIKSFSEGKLSITPDAVFAMEEYIATFGKELINKKYQYTPEATKALERLKNLKKELLKGNGLNSYLVAKAEIESKSDLSETQKNKKIEQLTGKARTKMEQMKSFSEEDLAAAPAFIAAFGYDKGNSLNSIARNFQKKVSRITAEKKIEEIKEHAAEVKVEASKEEMVTPKKTKTPKKSFWQKIKSGVNKAADFVKKSFKYWLPVFAIAGASGHLEVVKNPTAGQDKEDIKNKKEIKINTQQTQQKSDKDLDISLVTQCAKRLGFQNKLSSEEAISLTMENLQSLSQLPKRTKEQIAGETDLEKLAKLVVVRGDQNSLKQDIDSLINGQKIKDKQFQDICARTFKVTDDFSANKENNKQVGRQSLDMSSYLVAQNINGGKNS